MAPNRRTIPKTHELFRKSAPHPGGVTAGHKAVAPGRHRHPLGLIRKKKVGA